LKPQRSTALRDKGLTYHPARVAIMEKEEDCGKIHDAIAVLSNGHFPRKPAVMQLNRDKASRGVTILGRNVVPVLVLDLLLHGGCRHDDFKLGDIRGGM
jgi:hypothetical protein